MKDHPIHVTAETNSYLLLEMLDHNPALRDQRGWFGRLPIHSAAKAGESKCIALLLEKEASPNVKEDLFGETPLHFAVGSDSIECVELLLDAGANVNAPDKRGITPIFKCKSLQIIKRLEAHGADLSVIAGGEGYPHPFRNLYPFEFCAEFIRSIEIMQFWIDYGIDINHVPENSRSALSAITGMSHSSDKENDVKLLKLLIENGANVSLCDSSGVPPLYDACINSHTEFVKPLLEAGASPNQTNRAGDTPLHATVIRDLVDSARLLLEYGADVNLPNLYHKTPFCISKGKPEIRAILAPHYQPQEFPIPKSHQVIERLKKISVFQTIQFEGCSETEIDNLEKQLKLKFPKAYREFLAILGKGGGEFMLSDRWVFQFGDLPSIAHNNKYIEFCDLPEDYLVFAEQDGFRWVFFVANGSTDDPPVYLFDDSEDREYEQIGRSLWEFIESLVIDCEIWLSS